MTSFNPKYAITGALTTVVISALLGIWISPTVAFVIGFVVALTVVVRLEIQSVVTARYYRRLKLASRESRTSTRRDFAAHPSRLVRNLALYLEGALAAILVPYVSLRAAVQPPRTSWRIWNWVAVWERSESAVTDTVKGAVWALLLLAGLFLPIRVQPSLLADPAHAQSVLEFAANTVAILLALTVAVVLFAFQSFGTTRRGTSLSELITDARLMYPVYLGVTGLVADALTIAGIGTGAPGGWAGTWSLVLSAAYVPTVALLLWQAVRALDPVNLHRNRIWRLRRAVGSEIDEEVLQRLAYRKLDDICKELNITRVLGLEAMPEGWHILRAEGPGIVRDINIAALAHIRQHVTGGASPQLLTYVGHVIGADTPLMAVPSLKRLELATRRLITVSASQRVGIVEVAPRLHAEAVLAIREGLIDEFESIIRAWRETLVEFAMAWNRYGHDFGLRFSESVLPFRRSSIDLIVQLLYEEIVAVARAGNRDFASALNGLYFGLANAAIGAKSPMLLERTLRLVVLTYKVVRRTEPNEAVRLLSHTSWHVWIEIGRFVVLPAVRAGRLAPEESAEFIDIVESGFVDLIRASAQEQDLAVLSELDRQWEQFLRFDLETMTAPIREDQAALVHVIQTRRRSLRFALVVWASEKMWRRDESMSWPELFRLQLPHFPNPDSLVRQVESTLNEGRLSWSFWLSEDAAEDEVFTSSPVHETIRAFVLLMVVIALPDGLRAEDLLPPAPWLSMHEGILEATLNEIETDPDRLNAIIPRSTVATRLALLRVAVTSAADQERELERQALRRASTDPELVRAFGDAIREAWTTQRVARALFAFNGRYSEIVRADDAPATFGVRQWFPKDAFVKSDATVIWQPVAHQLGASLAQAELGPLLDELAISQSVKPNEDNGSISQQVQRAIDELTGHGYSPNFLLVPLDIELERGLGADFEPRWQLSSVPSEFQSITAAYRGLFRGLHVVNVGRRRALSNVFAVDLSRFAFWRQQRLPTEPWLTITATSYGPSEAAAVAEKLESSPNAVERPIDADWVMERVLLEILERFSVEVTDRQAAVRIPLDAS